MTDGCSICHNRENNHVHIAREMMFGLRDEFRYLECAACGCLQLIDIPTDWSRYYPPTYASLRTASRLKTYLRHQWASYTFGRFNPLGWTVAFALDPQPAIAAVRRACISKEANILDVGCGTGYLLQDMHYLGFQRLVGLDPHIEGDIEHPGGIRIHRCSIAEMEGSFDVIMLHHSFEHMDNPLSVMQHLARLLAPQGIVLLRIPVADSDAWRRYGVHWCNLDAPRHIFLHTRASIARLAKKTGLSVTRSYCDSWNVAHDSYLYSKGIPLNDPTHRWRKTIGDIIRRRNPWLKTQIHLLNSQNTGDAACFTLSRDDS